MDVFPLSQMDDTNWKKIFEHFTNLKKVFERFYCENLKRSII